MGVEDEAVWDKVISLESKENIIRTWSEEVTPVAAYNNRGDKSSGKSGVIQMVSSTSC